jgi:hypothetical protein
MIASSFTVMALVWERETLHAFREAERHFQHGPTAITRYAVSAAGERAASEWKLPEQIPGLPNEQDGGCDYVRADR